MLEACPGQSTWNKLLIKCVLHVGFPYIQFKPDLATAVKLIVGVESWTNRTICNNYGIVEPNLYIGHNTDKKWIKFQFLHFYTQTSVTSKFG